MMQVNLSTLNEDDEMVGALVSAATLRVVRSVSVSRMSRPSIGGAGGGGRKSVSGGQVTVTWTSSTPSSGAEGGEFVGGAVSSRLAFAPRGVTGGGGGGRRASSTI